MLDHQAEGGSPLIFKPRAASGSPLESIKKQEVIKMFNNNKSFWTAPRTEEEKKGKDYPRYRVSIEHWIFQVEPHMQRRFQAINHLIFRFMLEDGCIDKFNEAIQIRANGISNAFNMFFKKHPFAIAYFSKDSIFKDLLDMIENYNQFVKDILTPQTSGRNPFYQEVGLTTRQPAREDSVPGSAISTLRRRNGTSRLPIAMMTVDEGVESDIETPDAANSLAVAGNRRTTTL